VIFMRYPDEWDWGGDSDRIASTRFFWTCFWLTVATALFLVVFFIL